MSSHQIALLWRDRWASSELHLVEFAGPDRETLRLLDRHEVEEYPFVVADIGDPNETALDHGRWHACLRVQGQGAIFVANDGNWWVAIRSGAVPRPDQVEFMDPYGATSLEPADLIIPRDLGFRALRSWLSGRDWQVEGLDSELLRNRGSG